MADDLEVSTPPENIENIEKLLAHASTSNKQYSIKDRCGLRISFSGLLPLTEGDDGAELIWGSSIILNSSELEFPSVEYKLRAQTKKNCRNGLTCNRSKGTIKQNDILVITYQLIESSIESTSLTLIIDASPHEVPLYKLAKSDFYWIGKDTKVPTAAELVQKRNQTVSPNMDVTPKHISPGRLDNIPEGLNNYLLNDGFSSICKILQPHVQSLFKDLVEHGDRMKITSETTQIGNQIADGQCLSDALAEEIVRRFHAFNRITFTTTPLMLQ